MLVAAVGAQLPGASASESAVGAGAEEITLRLLYQLIVILLATRLVTAVVRRLGQTEVSGEILAGLLLGPSLLGALFPDLMHTLFPPSTGPIFTGLSPARPGQHRIKGEAREGVDRDFRAGAIIYTPEVPPSCP